MNFNKYIKAVGTGPKGNRDLSFAESEDMMTQILKEEVHPELISAFLLGWRMKPETIEEFQGALSALDAFCLHSEVKNSLELGYPFDGKAKNPYLLPLIGEILTKSDLQLVVLGDELQPAKAGVTTKELCATTKLPSNIHFFDRKTYSPALHELTDLRMRLTLRSGINTIEKLPNISQSEFAITGVHHKPYVAKYNAIFSSRYKRFALIQGNEGTPELFKKGTLWISEDGVTTEYSVDPADYGILSQEDLQGLATLNAAIFLFVSKKFVTIEEAFKSLSSI